MSVVSGSSFDIIGEWVMVRLLSDNMFDLLFLKFTGPACHFLML